MPKLNPNFLKSSEIVVRNIDPPATVEDKRKIWRGILAQEGSDRSFIEITDPYGFKDNVKELKESIIDIFNLVPNFHGSPNTDDNKLISSRLTHVSHRTQRMSTVDDSKRKIKQEIFRQILHLKSDLDEKSSYIKKVPIYKLQMNKKFSGKEFLVNVLELIDSLKSSRGCSDADLFDSADDLFEHEAWTFWHNGHIKQRFTDWQGLVFMLKKTFLHDNYDQILLNGNKSRKQSVKEPVFIFIASQEAQFYRLNSPPPESKMVNILHSNPLPDYVKALVLQDINYISELTSLCRRIEDAL
ncbi:hypothetical protein HHI36_008927 [Cryptolaemus montrouzieri]|uniref:Uncharacterized protein n=1 Tax=Cryptolaemus montrouzieri TaxID=559131 RepID=A0ABD2MUP6_9CUCU